MLNFVTTNPGKVREAVSYLDDDVTQFDFDYPEIQADDLAAVAAHGARSAYRAADGPVVVDDAGLFVDAFDGFPGPYSSYVEDTVGVERVWRMTEPEPDRSAAFKTVVAYCDGDALSAERVDEGERRATRGAVRGPGRRPPRRAPGRGWLRLRSDLRTRRDHLRRDGHRGEKRRLPPRARPRIVRRVVRRPMTVAGAALITGASAGIGAALAREFADNGHDVVLVARREERLRSLAAEVEREYGVDATPIAMDLDDARAALELYETVTDRGLEVGVLVNNVGVGTYGPFADSDLDAERTQLRLNVVLPVELTRLFLDEFDDGGAVLSVGSMAGFQPGPFLPGYYASKAYVNSFTQAIAEELRGTPVDVTVVCPGPVETEFQERAGMGDSTVGSLTTNTPEAVATAAYDGLVAGETVVVPSRLLRAVDVLGRLAPRSVTRRLARLVNEGR